MITQNFLDYFLLLLLCASSETGGVFLLLLMSPPSLIKDNKVYCTLTFFTDAPPP